MPLGYYHSLVKYNRPPIIVVPREIRDRLKTINLPLTTVLDYTEMKKHFVQDDIAELHSAQHAGPSYSDVINTTDLSGEYDCQLMEEWSERISKDQLKGFREDIAYMNSSRDKNVSILIERYREAANILVNVIADNNALDDRLEYANGIIFIILDGYMLLAHDKEPRSADNELIVRILKILYTYNKLSEVNGTLMFRLYLDSLGSR